MDVVKLALAVLLGALATGCKDKNPAGPSPPAAPAVTDLVITGVDAVLTGVSTTYTATATFSDGTTRAAMPTWTSNNTDVGSVDSAGRLEGHTHGSTSLMASYEGLTASKTIHVVNNYEGNWTGTYVIRACDDSGIYKDGVFGGTLTDVPWCQAFDRLGSVHSIMLALSQTGSNRSEIRARMPEIDSQGCYLSVCVRRYTGNITGVVTTDGRLNLGGTLRVLDWWEGEPAIETLHIVAWYTNLNGSGVMAGRWSQNRVAVIGVGNVYTTNELVTMTRTANEGNLKARAGPTRSERSALSGFQLHHLEGSERLGPVTFEVTHITPTR